MGISDTMFSLGDMWWMGNLAKVEREREVVLHSWYTKCEEFPIVMIHRTVSSERLSVEYRGFKFDVNYWGA